MGETTDLAVLLVLCAAFLHAIWNAIIKGSGDQTLSLGLVSLPHVVIGGALALIFLPPLEESWPFIAASTGIHFFYYAFLLRSYRIGDLSQVYPISRGIAPVLVTVGAQVFTGEVLPLIGWVGVLMVSIGVSLPAFFSRTGLGNKKAILAALMTGVFIASYSVVDGMGVRVSGSPLGYIGWLFVCEIFVILFIFHRRRNRLRQTPTKVWITGLLGGAASATAYGLAIYAKTLAPLGTVSAVRESSVVIAALIGVIWFHERPWEIRLVSAIVVAAGVITLAIVS
jgi:drug/metabolite transporter (DMT)-like permease